MKAAVVSVMLLVTVSSAGADTVLTPDPGVRTSLALDGTLTLAAGISFFGSQTFLKVVTPEACGWCDSSLNEIDEEMREHFRWGNVQLARNISNIGLYGLPVAALAITGLRAESREIWLEDTILILEAAMMTMNVNQIAKYSASRTRPMVRFGLEEPDADSYVSFFSGHTSLVTSMAVSTGTIFFMRKRREAPWVLGIGVGVAALTGYMRIAGDKHYFTDVLVGAGFGTAIGFSVPYLHRHLPNVKISAVPVKEGALVGIGGRF